jgi:hypothetical protein
MHDSVRVGFESTESVCEWRRSTQYEQCLGPGVGVRCIAAVPPHCMQFSPPGPCCPMRANGLCSSAKQEGSGHDHPAPTAERSVKLVLPLRLSQW